MTGEEFIFLSKHASGQTEVQPRPVTDTERKYVYGILGIAKLFGCSLPTANRIKKSGKIDKAITQIGRKIIVDVELALELAGKKTESGVGEAVSGALPLLCKYVPASGYGFERGAILVRIKHSVFFLNH